MNNGIGKCYPVLRSHTVLNTMHQAIDKVPVVMLYPGKYSGQDLLLFGEIKDEIIIVPLNWWTEEALKWVQTK